MSEQFETQAPGEGAARDHQAPQYQQPHQHDTAYQPLEQGDAGEYQPHANREVEHEPVELVEEGDRLVETEEER